MGLFDNDFVRACRSGFGMDNNATKAVGMMILFFFFAFILLWYCIKGFIWVCKKLFSGKKKTIDDAVVIEELNNQQSASDKQETLVQDEDATT